MAHFHPNADPANLVMSPMPVTNQENNMNHEAIMFQEAMMGQGLIMDQGTDMNIELNMAQGLAMNQGPAAFNFGAAGASSLPNTNHVEPSNMSPQTMHTMAMTPHSMGVMNAMYTPAHLPSQLFKNQNNSDPSIKQQSPQFMASAIPMAGFDAANRLNTSISSISTNQTDMSDAMLFSDTDDFGKNLASPSGMYSGVPMARNNSSGTDVSGVVSSANSARSSKARITKENVLANYPEYMAYTAEREKQTKKGTGAKGPRRPRAARSANLSPEAKEIRKEQNRNAQRNYRERKEAELQNARETLDDLFEKHSQALNDNTDLKETLDSANLQITALQEQLMACSLGGSQ